LPGSRERARMLDRAAGDHAKPHRAAELPLLSKRTFLNAG